MKFAIIGAGVAGLASARRCLENGYEVLVYERSKGVGGTWVYDERIGLDEFGLPIHTSMYKNLMYAPILTIIVFFSVYLIIKLNYSFCVFLCFLGQICQKN